MHDDRGGFEPAVNPLPPVVWALFFVMMGTEAVFFLGAEGIIGGPSAIGWRLEAVRRFGFSSEILDWMITSGEWPVEYLIRFVAYPFVHGGFTHALFAGVILLAMGKFVGEGFGPIALLAIFVLSGIGGALAYGLLVDSRVLLIGAFPPLYGLIGAFTFLLWQSLGVVGARQARAFSLIGFLMGFQLLFGLLFGGTRDWVADLAGFACGFALSVVLAPGGVARLLSRIRRR